MLSEHICDPQMSLQNVCHSLGYTYFRVYRDQQSIQQTFPPVCDKIPQLVENCSPCGGRAISRLSYGGRNEVRTVVFSRA